MNKHRLHIPTLAICLLFLTGCGTLENLFSSRGDESRKPSPLESIDEEVRIRKVWSTGVGDGQGDAYHYLRPVINDDVIYAAGSDGTVVALNRNDGSKIWERDLELPVSGGVGYGSGMVLLGSGDGMAIALDAADGSELWRATIPGEILAPPQTNGEIVVVQDYTGKVRGLEADGGADLWMYDSSLPVLTLRGTSTPLIIDRLAVVGFGNGKVVALEVESGALAWEVRVAIPEGRSEIERMVDVDGTMVRVGATLFAASYQGQLAAIDINSGSRVWQEEVSSYNGVDHGFGNIYVADEEGTVTAFRRNGDGIRWQQSALAHRRLSAPKTVRGYVAVGDLEGYVHILSQVDGRMVGRVQVDGKGIRGDMLSVDNTLYVFGNGGALVALDVSARDSS